MDAYARPLRDLYEKLTWFVRAKQVRLVHIVADSDLRPGALKVAAAMEFHPDNPSPFLVLEDAGWPERTERARALHDARRETMASLPALPARPVGLAPLPGFAAQLQQIVRARCEPLDGLVVVLAPTRIEDEERWASDVEQLVLAQPLLPIRWIVVESGQQTLDALVQRLGDQALSVSCRIDREEERRDLDRQLDAMAECPASAPAAARAGAAWPKGVKPPERPGTTKASPDVRSEIARRLGPAAALLGEGGAELQRKILGAAKAAREQRGPDAVRLQREARDFCRAAGLEQEAIILELGLGAYAIQFGDRKLASRVYQEATEHAKQAALWDLAAQGQMALGALALVDKQVPSAVGAFARAAGHAQRSGIALLAIESWRMAGHAALKAGDEPSAIKAWRAALDVAGAAPPAEAAVSSAAETARALAEVCRKHGLKQQADALLAQADQLESGAASETEAARATGGRS